jgi:CRP/FNR family transcriptional regulator, cyclic AMP receptor protein
VRLHRNAKVDLLRRVPLFAGLSRRELERLGAIADELDLGAGRTLIKEGTRGREFFVLVEGDAKVAKNGRRVATLSDGDFFGEIALVTDVPRTSTVTAETPVRLLVLTKRDFQRLLREQPAIQRKVLEALALRLAPKTV